MPFQVLRVVNETQYFDDVVFDAVDEIVAGPANELVVGHAMAAELQMVRMNRMGKFGRRSDP